MFNQTITLTYNKGTNTFIDYLKGVSIVFVILTHSLYPIKDVLLFNLWGMQAVPFFLIISSSLFFRKGIPTTISFNLTKLTTRIILPYLLFSLVLASISIAVGKDTYSSAIIALVHDAGMGPGAYYVPLYIQYYLLLPLFALLIRKSKYPFLFTMLLSIVLEVLANHFLPIWIYRLSVIRYLPLLYVGFRWATKGITLNNKTFLLSLFSAIAILILTYSGWRFNPLFCTFHPWEYANWICYAYPAFLLPFLFYALYQCSSKSLNHCIERLGKDSLEIFMMQMGVFYFFPVDFYLRHYSAHPILIYIICTLVSMTASIAPVILYKNLKHRLA